MREGYAATTTLTHFTKARHVSHQNAPLLYFLFLFLFIPPPSLAVISLYSEVLEAKVKRKKEKRKKTDQKRRA